jgi:large subunit ribosomal protein L21
MFAIIKTGGKQYKVAANDLIRVEKLLAASGDTVEFTDVLMMGQEGSVKIGSPLVTNARVCGTVVDQIRDDKVIIFKKKRRHNYRRKNGHRQYLTVVRITDILGEGQSPKAKAAPVKAEAKPEKIAAPKAAKPATKAAPKETKTTKKTSKE